jgi:hypothetical protein
MLVSLKKYKVNLGGGVKVYSCFKLYKQSKSGLVLTPQEMLDIFSTGML